jgi:hypothetical protein
MAALAAFFSSGVLYKRGRAMDRKRGLSFLYETQLDQLDQLDH